MFNNIGGKIKGLATVLTSAGIIASCIIGIIYILSGDGDNVLQGFLILAIGSLSSWLGSFLLYGFGQLVENSDILVYYAERDRTEDRQRQTETYVRWWKCPECGFQNKESEQQCAQCKADKT